MMSVAGAVLVLLAACGAAHGVRRAMYLRGRELNWWLLALRLLAREMMFGGAPLPRVCARLAEQVDGVVGKFWAALAENLRRGANLPGAWQEVQRDLGAGWHLLAEDEAVLAELGAGLGQTDLAGQRKLLAECEVRLADLLAASEARYGRLARLISGLGWCGGLLLVCLCL